MVKNRFLRRQRRAEQQQQNHQQVQQLQFQDVTKAQARLHQVAALLQKSKINGN